MSSLTTKLDQSFATVQKHRHLLLPLAAAGLIFVLLVPLPPGLMNVLLVGNMALAAIILLTTLAVGRPLEFCSFPSVLLGATLLRLVLNVALTRLILTAGADGQDVEQACYAAGSVVWSFSDLVARGSVAVGLILLSIIIIIQFIVVTKGAARISEVAARFVLDAMPGKQMAIDADLAAKAITPAKARRAEVAREADFYGAMDGASKFVRGDAVAAVIIILVNLFGGMYVGLVQRGWDWGRTVELFSRLTIGDALVTQIPAFVVSLASALIVTRSASRSNLGEQVSSQLLSRPAVLLTTAGFLALLAFASLPALPLALIGGGCVAVAWAVSRRQDRPEAAAEETTGAAPVAASASAAPAPATADHVGRVDPISVELGCSLVGLAGDLLPRIDEVRRKIASDLGVQVPPVRVKDNLQLAATEYAIKIRSAKVAGGRAYPGQLLAVLDETIEPAPSGRQVREPLRGRPAVWVALPQAARLEATGLRTTTPAELIIHHLQVTLRRHAHELLSRQQVADMLQAMRSRCESLVAEVAKRYPMGTIQKVLQGLLQEAVPVSDLETILEAMSDWPGEADDVHFLGEHVRGSLARTLSQQYCSGDGKLWCVALPGDLEEGVASCIHRHSRGQAGEESELTTRLHGSLDEPLEALRRDGRHAVVLCSPAVRRALHQLIQSAGMEATVLAYNEIDSVEIKTFSSLGIET